MLTLSTFQGKSSADCNYFVMYFSIFPESGVSMHMYPFKHCIIRNFVQDDNYLEHLKEELFQLQFTEKSNDLYKFNQVFVNLIINYEFYFIHHHDEILLSQTSSAASPYLPFLLNQL
jgi:hypothetical protein